MCATTDVVPDTEAPYWNADNHDDVSDATVWPTPPIVYINGSATYADVECAVATDDSGTVWYKFIQTDGPSPGTNSGWQQDDPTWTNNTFTSNVVGLAYKVIICDQPSDVLGNRRESGKILAVQGP